LRHRPTSGWCRASSTKPQVYADFLGKELSFLYKNRLLVVMPAGFGVYNRGAPTRAEKSRLAGVKIDGPDPDNLTRAATAAVHSLTGDKPAPKDTLSPKVIVIAVIGVVLAGLLALGVLLLVRRRSAQACESS
jgi:hypothetical protein